MIKIKLALFLFVLSTSSFSASEEQSTIIWATASQMWPPIFYQKQDGEFAGLSYEIADLVFKQKLNLELEVNLFPWKRAQYNVREGNADFLVTLPTPERLEYAVASDASLYSVYFQVYTYASHPRIEEIRNIKNLDDVARLGLSTVSNDGNNWHKTNVESKGIKTFYVRSDSTMALFLARKRADLIIDTPFSINNKIIDQNLQDQIEIVNVRIDEVFFKVLLGKESIYFKDWDKINNAITQAAESGEIKKILLRYMME